MLVENEADFSIELVNNLYATVTRMLPEYFKNFKDEKIRQEVLEDPENNGNFVKRKMLSDEPDIPLHARNEVKTEEGKFEQAENFDKNFLTKRYPSLALPN